MQKDNATLVDLLRHRARSESDKRAYTFLKDGEVEEASLTHGQLDRQARAIAARLREITTPGDRALLLYPAGLEFIAAFFGCLYAGVIAVPTYPPRQNRTDARFAAIALDAQASVVLTTAEILSGLDARLTEMPELRDLHRLATDDADIEMASGWRMPDIDSETLAFLQYTSGSTGTPKGVMVSHRNLIHNLEYTKRGGELGPADTGVFWLPAYHDMGLISGIIKPVYTGIYNILMSPAAFLQRPFRWLRAISHYKATYGGGPDFAYALCVDKVRDEDCEGLDLSHWRCAFNGAEPIRKETLDRFADKFGTCGFRKEYFYPCYGLAEVVLAASGPFIADEPIVFEANEAHLGKHRVRQSCQGDSGVKFLIGSGHAWPGMEVMIVDPETSIPCSPDRIGEIWIRGESVTQGYWNRPEKTEQTFHAYLADTDAGPGDGPFLRTGDFGFIRDSELFVTGRMKDLIIIRGQNYYPQDIEFTVARSHPALAPNCGAAFGIDLENQERLAIVQEVRREHVRKLDARRVTEAIRKAVAKEHELQAYVVILIRPGTIPKTSSGKIQRGLCVKKFFTDFSNNDTNVLVRSMATMDKEQQKQDKESMLLRKLLEVKDPTARLPLVELYLLEQLSELVGLPATEIDTEELIIALGIDSMIAVGFVRALEEDLGVSLRMEELLEEATIVNLAREINEQLSANNAGKSEGDA
uniref:Acyl-CoA synthetase (AMP-forming)/AMP-acid ligase II n=1 Tax=Candidatus Kentrum sp. FW TaxID=2126338 RepID=A0A450TVX5_9GAMM|nr:MAG: Acyl-CoA synthetase (AMP-forming)/AMP-acid ligase II [Candidatus Kentron sp. FW]